MLGPVRPAVKPARASNRCRRAAFARTGGPRQTGDPPAAAAPVIQIIIALSAAALLFFFAWTVSHRRSASRRQRAVSGVLDAADALEERLRTARAEIEAVAGDAKNPVRDAMQEMLRQRLWLQQHGGEATVQQLDSVRESIDDARERIDQQLLQIERARSVLH